MAETAHVQPQKAAAAPELTFPALFCSADNTAAEQQSRYLLLIRAEYGLLVLAAVLALDLSNASGFFAVYAIVLVLGLAVLLLRSTTKPEQEWYRSRALAESIKTSTWRYVMRADPFGSADPVSARAAFRAYLSGVIDSNKHIAATLAAPIDAVPQQTTPEMEAVRSLSWEDRRAYYLKHRIEDQLAWYSRKAAFNKAMSERWMVIGVLIYLAALVLVILRVAFPDFSSVWPIEPLLVLASSVIGWTQIKKFNELASVYSLTTHEVSLIRGKIQDVDQEGDVSKFVNEAELAFSREHTQWVARQTEH